MANPKGNASKYQAVAAGQTAAVVKNAAGESGDYISRLLVIPATTSPGNVLLLDGASSITLFAGGASSVADLKPFEIPLEMSSKNGSWKITTGANVSVLCIGRFV